jgi:ADP-ribose pyrophosphatase
VGGRGAPVSERARKAQELCGGRRVRVRVYAYASSLDVVASVDEVTKRFRNPGGPVGLSGRGLLGRYGPNHAADPIVTRFHKGRLQVVLVRRRDTDELAFPGGMVDPGSTVSRTLKGEFTEEAAKPGGAVDRLFAEGERGVVYRGLVDDPRTTDHAWIETTAVHFHAPPDVADEESSR